MAPQNLQVPANVFLFVGKKARRSVGKSVIATRAALDQHLLVLLHLLVLILISEVLFEKSLLNKDYYYY